MDIKNVLDIIASILGIIISLWTIYEKLFNVEKPSLSTTISKNIADQILTYIFFVVLLLSVFGIIYFIALFVSPSNEPPTDLINLIWASPLILFLIFLFASDNKVAFFFITIPIAFIVAYLAYTITTYSIIAALFMVAVYTYSVFKN